MKVWMWLCGTISSISFAQIATTPGNINPVNYFQLTPAYNQSIFPDYHPKLRFGALATNLVTGTDLSQANLWFDLQRRKHAHRVQYHQIGSSDFVDRWIESIHLLKIHQHWQLGTGLTLRNAPFQKTELGGHFLIANQYKNQQLAYRLTLHPNYWEHLLTWSQQFHDQSIGGVIQYEATNYQAYAYVETALSSKDQIVISLGTGTKRILLFFCRNIQYFQLQVGGAWLQPLNRISPFFQLSYDLQTRDKIRSAGLCLPPINRSNPRLANRMDIPSS